MWALIQEEYKNVCRKRGQDPYKLWDSTDDRTIQKTRANKTLEDYGCKR